MSLERRVRLLDLAYRFRVPVVEDDVYGALWYDEPPPPTLAALDRHGFVLYAGSFSKVLCPGLRVGWIAGPRPLIRRLVQVKQIIDLQAPTLSQMMVERLLVSGDYARHRGAGAQALRAPRRHGGALAPAARERLGRVGPCPAGGFYYWCRLESPLAAAALAAEAAEKRVSILPGRPASPWSRWMNRIRLSFSCCDAGGDRRRDRAARARGAPRETPRARGIGSRGCDHARSSESDRQRRPAARRRAAPSEGGIMKTALCETDERRASFGHPRAAAS